MDPRVGGVLSTPYANGVTRHNLNGSVANMTMGTAPLQEELHVAGYREVA